jgi:hypothetical protein
VIPVALGIAGLALFAAFRGWSGAPGVAVGSAPMGEIDDASRVRLERVLRAAELEEAGE